MPRENKHRTLARRLRFPTYSQDRAEEKAAELIDEFSLAERTALVRIAAKNSPSDQQTINRVSAALYAVVAIEVGMGRPFKDADGRLRFLRKILRGSLAPQNPTPGATTAPGAIPS